MGIFKSKKFLAAIAGLIVAIAAHAGFDLSQEDVLTILSPILAYIGGQGMADIGKEKAKIDNQGG